MLAMQYSFTLPADYDMSIIRHRIAANGHRMDGFPRLVFKAFLHAGRDPQREHARENLYAPFYLWEDNDGMNRFLSSAGFAALAASFGWPVVRTWSVWKSRLLPTLAQAGCATREIIQIAPHTALDELQQAECRQVDVDMDEHAALGAVVGFEPGSWTLVRFRLWRTYQSHFDRPGVQAYEVGHLSAGPATEGRYET